MEKIFSMGVYAQFWGRKSEDFENVEILSEINCRTCVQAIIYHSGVFFQIKSFFLVLACDVSFRERIQIESGTGWNEDTGMSYQPESFLRVE